MPWWAEWLIQLTQTLVWPTALVLICRIAFCTVRERRNSCDPTQGVPKSEDPGTPSRRDYPEAVYTAIANYHNNLVHMRFTVAGLFLAANSLLVSGFFLQVEHPFWRWLCFPIAGMGLSIVCWLLEARTSNLLDNLVHRGSGLETVSEDAGFFSLMKGQGWIIPKRLFPFRLEVPEVIKPYVRHSVGISALYGLIGFGFWVSMLVGASAGLFTT